jgi:putative transposase
MPRRARLALDGVSVHLVQRGIDRSACFFCDDDRLHYLALLAELAPALGCVVHAYVLMTNHVHLLATPARAAALSQLMRQLNQRYVQAINRAYRRSGTLWEGRFRSCLVENEGYVLACYRYIELNPVRAGMVDGPLDYPWSSHRMNASGLSSNLVAPHDVFVALASDPAARAAAYRGLVAEAMPRETLAAIRHATAGSYALGSARFQSEVAAMAGRRVVPGLPGRPQRER